MQNIFQLEFIRSSIWCRVYKNKYESWCNISRDAYYSSVIKTICTAALLSSDGVIILLADKIS